MQKDVLVYEIRQLLDKKTIHDILRLTRALSIKHRANEKKEALVELIIGFAEGNVDPTPRTGRGAPPKSNEYDRELAETVLKCRESNLTALRSEGNRSSYVEVHDGKWQESCGFAGLLEQGSRFFFVRDVRSAGAKDIYVNPVFIEKYNLKVGDYITGVAAYNGNSGLRAIESLSSVNGIQPDRLGARRDFSEFTASYPDSRITIAVGADDVCGRLIDMFVPLGAGQRCVISAARQTGKTCLLKRIAVGIKQNQPYFKIIVLSIGALPEEITDFNDLAPNADVFCSPFESEYFEHTRLVGIVGEYAKRCVESGENVVLLVDGLETLISSCVAPGRVGNAPTENSLAEARRLVSLARNIKDGGSLTLISTFTLRDVQSPFAEEILQAFNMRITLCEGRFAGTGYFPLPDIEKSRSGRRELFTTRDECAAADNLYEKIAAGMSRKELLEIFKRTRNNAEIVEEYK